MKRAPVLIVLLLAGAAAAEEPEPASAARAADQALSGVVVDDGGQPVSDANVWLIGASLKLEAETQGQTQTDAQGRFEIAVPERWSTRVMYQPGHCAVCAWKDGRRLAVRALPQRSVPARGSVRLVLQPADPVPLLVHDPAGQPAAGIRVRLNAVTLSSGLTSLPDDVSDKFAFTTDENGRGELTAVAVDQIGHIVLDSKQFGEQHLLLPPTDGWTAPLVLGAAGRLKGRITAEDPKLVDGLAVDVLTGEFNEHGGQVAMGRARVTTDAAGRFEIPAIRHGPLRTQVTLPAETPWRARTTQSKQELLHLATDWAVAGEVTEVEIPLEPAVRVTGIVREQSTGEPVPDVSLQINSRAGWNETVRTGDDGRFTTHVLPGHVLTFPWCPRGWFATKPNVGVPAVRVREKPLELPAVELLRAVTVRGRVVDEQGQPAAGATVRAVWNYAIEGSPSNPDEAQVTTDDEGQFAVAGVHPQARLGLWARNADAVTERMLQWQPTAPEPLTLTVSEKHWLRPGGRVIDSTGAPVAGATVTVWTQIQSVTNPHDTIEGRVEHQPPIRTDEQGHFTEPPRLEPYGFYRVEATAAGFDTAHTDWVGFSQLGSGFPPVVLRRVVHVSGRVVDAQGAAIGGAAVTLDNGRERTEVAADADGRFQFARVPAGMSFLVVRKSGYRLAGRLVGADADVTLTLHALNDANAPAMHALPPALEREERLALARKLIDPLLKPGAEHHEAYTMKAAEALALIDPAGAIEWLAAEPEKPLEVSMMTRMTAAQQLAKTEPDDALAIGESLKDPMWRGKVYLDVCDALPDSARARKLEMLSEATLNARGHENPMFRVILLGQVAERLLDLGETDAATKLLREAEPVAREFPPEEFAGYIRGAFAEELAQIDLEAALELTKDLKDEYEYNRHHGNIAHELAGKQPADAARVLDLVKREGTQYLVQPRDQYLVRVCYRMARVDLDRARQLADSAHDPCQGAFAYGMMAQALAETDKPAAEKLLREAFRLLKARVDSGEDRFNYMYSASTVAGALLPVAEAIGPALLSELFWEALALRLLPDGGEADANIELANAALARFLAIYDRDVARSLLLGANAQTRRNENWLRATTLADPHAAIALVQTLEATDEVLRNQKARDAVTVARILALDGEDLHHELLRHSGLWIADTEDL